MEQNNPPPGGNAAATSSTDRKIFLNVISPSVEAPQKLTYPDIPTSTTIIELKRRIQNDVETRPSPERQRIIYRGRALVQEDKTLEDVFGHEAVWRRLLPTVETRTNGGRQIAASDVFSVHLVLPPIPGTSSASGLNAQARHPIPTNLSAVPQNPTVSVPPRPASTGQLPSGIGATQILQGVNNAGMGPLLHHPPMPGQAMAFNPGPLPAPLQEQLNAHMAAMGQPFGGQTAPVGFQTNVVMQPGQHFAGVWPQQPQFPQVPLFQQPNFQHILAQQQQARAVAGMQGLGNMGINQGLNQDATPVPQQGQASGGTDDPSNRPLGQGTSSTVVREGQGPNGAQWRLVINQSVTPLGPLNAPGPAVHVPTQQPGSQPTSTLRSLAANIPNTHPDQPPLPSHPNIGRQSPVPMFGRDNTSPSDTYALIDLRLSHLERYLAHGIAPSDNEISQARHQLLLWQSQQLVFNSALEIPLVTRMTNIASRASQVRHGFGVATNQFAHGQRIALPTMTTSTTGQTASGSATTSSTTTSTVANAMVYLISSPSGPHALLVSPMGMYTSSNPGVGMVQPVNSTFAHSARPAAVNHAVPTPVRPNDAGAPAVQDPQRDPQVQQPDQVRDLIRIVLPLGGHLWLLIRLFGFVYFFTSGAGWYRTTLLGVCAFFVFIAQTGILRPLQRAIWDPLRRHVEALVPLAGNNGNAGADGVPAPPNGQGAAATQPNPRHMADRLLQNQNGGGGLVRRNIRRVERAMALFVASLVPGVGERHIAARDAAEAARQAAEREREEQVRREEEARQQAEGIEGAVAEDNPAIADESAVRQEDHAGQQPLVEI